MGGSETVLVKLRYDLVEQLELSQCMGGIGGVSCGKVSKQPLDMNSRQLMQAAHKFQHFSRQQTIAPHTGVHFDVHREADSQSPGMMREGLGEFQGDQAGSQTPAGSHFGPIWWGIAHHKDGCIDACLAQLDGFNQAVHCQTRSTSLPELRGRQEPPRAHRRWL